MFPVLTAVILKRGRSDTVFGCWKFPGMKYGVPEHRKPGKGISPLFGNLYIVNKLRRFNFHRIKENTNVRRSV